MKNTALSLLMLCSSISIHAQEPHRYEVVINEIMANPSGTSLLPNSKYIELLNVSATAIDLYDWKISDGINTAIIKEHFQLFPDSCVIICPAVNAPSFSALGTAIGVTRFPSLRVNGDLIWLQSANDAIMHAVNYKRDWYKNEVKSAGGWSLEMTDPYNPCGGDNNWSASNDSRGGTPGTANSIAGSNPDRDAPQLLHAYTTDSLHIMVILNEPADSAHAAIISNYTISDRVSIAAATPLPPLFDRVLLTLAHPLQKRKLYTLNGNHITDCSGNPIVNNSFVQTGIDELPVKGDLIINEILFNPPADGADYVELYNRSPYPIDLQNLFIANRNSSGNIANLKQLSSEKLLILPAAYLTVTDNAAIVQRQYLVKKPQWLIEISSLPSFPNASGTVVLLNNTGDIIDELQYNEKWHYELIGNYKGVALERISFYGATQDPNNWHSAAASAGYGTPTYQNSQFALGNDIKGEVNLSPRIFSPDNDGFDDYLLVNYRFPENGFVCNITIFDSKGRTIRHLVRNGLCGTEGYYKWDGLDENYQALPMGIYIVFTEVFHPSGKTKKFKQAITLARRRT